MSPATVTVPAGAATALSRDGFCFVNGLIPADAAQGLLADVRRLLAEEGERAGSEFVREEGAGRLAALVGKAPGFARLACRAEVLGYVEAVLGADYKLSSVNARVVPARSGPLQPLHADMSAIADPDPWVVNIIVYLNLGEYARGTSPLRAVPGSHRWGRLPAAEMADPSAPHPAQVPGVGRARPGDAFVFNAHLWHGGCPNTSDEDYVSLHLFYCRRDKPHQQWQKRVIPPAAQAALSADARWVCALDDARNDRIMSGVKQHASGAMPRPRL